MDHLSQFDDALALIRDIGLRSQDEKLFMAKAGIEHRSGQNLQAISTLISFLESNPENIEAARFLIEILRAENPSEAFRHAKALHEQFSERADICVFTMQMAFLTDHYEYGHKLMTSLAQKDPEHNYLRPISNEELLAFFNESEGNNAANEVEGKWLKGQALFHLMLDVKKRNRLGFDFYCNMAEHMDYFLPICYGARAEAAIPFDSINEEGIALDYSAVCVAYALDLFPDLQKSFKKNIYPRSCFQV